MIPNLRPPRGWIFPTAIFFVLPEYAIAPRTPAV